MKDYREDVRGYVVFYLLLIYIEMTVFPELSRAILPFPYQPMRIFRELFSILVKALFMQNDLGTCLVCHLVFFCGVLI